MRLGLKCGPIIGALREPGYPEKGMNVGTLFETGVRPAIDAYLKAKSEEVRSYGDYWSASSAGYCMRLNIMRRLKIPKVPELADNAALTRVFESGHIFHEWIQRITKANGLSIAQELELQDEDLMIRGHIDDLVLVRKPSSSIKPDIRTEKEDGFVETKQQPQVINLLDDSHLILYDYKTQNSMAFTWQKGRPMSYYHKMQLGTYMYMLRNFKSAAPNNSLRDKYKINGLSEARILKLSKDDLRMSEQQLMWTEELHQEVLDYWKAVNKAWVVYNMTGKLPDCTCLDHEGGFLGKRSAKGKIYGDFYYEEEPCSLKWFELNKVKE